MKFQCSRQHILLYILLVGLSILLTEKFFSLPRGLIGDYYANMEWAGLPVMTTQTPSLNLQPGSDELPLRHYSVKWTGKIFIPVSGNYHFSIYTDGFSGLEIDECIIIQQQASPGLNERSGSIFLEQGFYPIVFRYVHKDGPMEFDVYWTSPGKSQERLPSRLLFAERPDYGALRLERIITGIKYVWLAGIFIGILIFFSTHQRYARLTASVNLTLLCLLVLLGFLNIPYFAPAYEFIPADDTMHAAQQFFMMYNEYFLHKEMPLWMPYYVYGSASDTMILHTMTPAFSFVAFVGQLLTIEDALFLFKVAMLLEQLALLVGIYLLSQRLFLYETTIFLVSSSVLATSFFAIQIYFNFRLYYLIPLTLFFLITFFDTLDFRYLLLSGIVTGLSLCGNLSYYVPFYLFFYGVFGVVLCWPKRRSFPALFKTLMTPLTVVFFCLFLVILVLFWGMTREVFTYTMLYFPDRDHGTGTVALNTFLVYGAELGKHLLECIYAALSFIAPIVYLFFPFFDYFRHLGYLRAVLRILCLLLAGYGLESYLRSTDEKRANILSIQWFGLGMAGCIIIFDFFEFHNKTTPYASFITKPALFHFHFFALAVLLLFLSLLYRVAYFKTGSLRGVLIACVLLEMISYHYFLCFITPVKLPQIEAQPYETVESLQNKIKSFHTSFHVFNYDFQDTRTMPPETLQSIRAANPLLLVYYGTKHSMLYSAAYTDSCLQELRIEYVPLGIDRLIRARAGIPLDKPLVGGAPLPYPPEASITFTGIAPNDLARDQHLLRAMGCNTPKVFLASHIRYAHTLEEAANIIQHSSDFDTIPVIFTETGQKFSSQPFSPSQEATGTVAIKRFTANVLEVQAHVSSPEGAWLIYLDAYHPRWEAEVNGVKKTIFTANLAFKAVELSPGENTVRFAFTGNTFSQIYTQVFFYLGILSVLLLFGILQRHIRHTRQVSSGSSGE